MKAGLPHGKQSTYAAGCRCEPCRAAHASHNGAWYHANSRRILDAEAARRPKRTCARCPEPAARKSKYCASCRVTSRRELHRAFAAAQRKDPAVKEAQRVAAAEYRRRFPEKIRENNRRSHARPRYLLRQYGLTAEQFEAMQIAQGERCAICRREAPLLHVDHDHATNVVRALLCGPCNKGIGLFGEDPARLSAAIDYLRRHAPALVG